MKEVTEKKIEVCVSKKTTPNPRSFQEVQKESLKEPLNAPLTDDKDSEEKESCPQPVVLPHTQKMIEPCTDTPEGVGGVAGLSMEWKEFFPHLIQKIQIIEVQNPGIITTEVSIQTEKLSNIEVVLEKYDTDPTSFNITLSGNIKAQALFAQEQQALTKALNKALPTMRCHFLPFSCTKEMRSPARRASNGKNHAEKKSIVAEAQLGYCKK